MKKKINKAALGPKKPGTILDKAGNAAGKKEREVIGQILITQYDNGEIEFGVNMIAPDNLLVIMDVINRGEKVLLDDLKQKMLQRISPILTRQDPKIIVPGMGNGK